MKVKDSCKFLDDKIEMAGVVTEPKASGRMRACEKEYDVCSSLPRSLSAESEFDAGVKGGSPRTTNMMIDLVKMLRDVFLMRASYVNVQQAVQEVRSKQKYMKASHTWLHLHGSML